MKPKRKIIKTPEGPALAYHAVRQLHTGAVILFLTLQGATAFHADVDLVSEAFPGKYQIQTYDTMDAALTRIYHVTACAVPFRENELPALVKKLTDDGLKVVVCRKVIGKEKGYSLEVHEPKKKKIVEP